MCPPFLFALDAPNGLIAKVGGPPFKTAHNGK